MQYMASMLLYLRVSLLVLHGGEAALCCQQVAHITRGGPGQESIEHALTHLESRLKQACTSGKKTSKECAHNRVTEYCTYVHVCVYNTQDNYHGERLCKSIRTVCTSTSMRVTHASGTSRGNTGNYTFPTTTCTCTCTCRLHDDTLKIYK